MKQPNRKRLMERYEERFCFNTADIRYIFDDISWNTGNKYKNEIEIFAIKKGCTKDFPPKLIPRKWFLLWLGIEEKDLLIE